MLCGEAVPEIGRRGVAAQPFPRGFGFAGGERFNALVTASLLGSKGGEQMTEFFTYGIAGVPDIDQRWNFLQSNGAGYCVPACTMNWMYYISAHGNPSAVDWPPNNITLPVELMVMGWYMGTNPASGTSFDDGVDGTLNWFDDRGIWEIMSASSVSEDGDDITFDTLKNLLVFGSLVNVRGGRYSKDDSDEYQRLSGHCLTMTGLQRSDESYLLKIHNPDNTAANANLSSQSPVVESSVDLHPTTANLEGDTVDVFQWGTSTNPYRFLDGYSAILPTFGLTNSTARLIDIVTYSLQKQSVETRRLKLPFAEPLADLAIDPLQPVAAALSSNGEISTVALSGSDWTTPTTVEGARKIAFGIAGRLYACTEREVVLLDRSGRTVERVPVPGQVSDIAYDVRERQLHVLSADGRAATRLSPTLTVVGTDEVPTVPGQGPLKLDVLPRDSTLVVTRPESRALAQIRRHRSGATVRAVVELDASSEGRARVRGDRVIWRTVDGRIASFSTDGERLRGHVLDGLKAGPVLEVATGGCSCNRARSHLPAWRDASAVS
jgi:hypothetical protein